MEEYRADDEAISVVDYRHGWSTVTREEDIEQYQDSEEGYRKYEAWEVVDNALAKHGSKAQEILNQMKARSLTEAR